MGRRGLALGMLLQGLCRPPSKFLLPKLRPREQAFGSPKPQRGGVSCRTEEELVGVVRALGPFLTLWVPTPLRGAGVFS